MNPDQPQYSIDYLNQIAPQAPKKSGLSRVQLVAVIATLVAVLVVGILSIVLAMNGDSGSSTRLAARLQSTETIVKDAQDKLKSTQMRTLNSNLMIYLANTNRDIATPLLKDGVDVTKLSKSLLASESNPEMTNRLEDARLNAVYDRTYAREMSYQLETITALMLKIYNSTNDESLKTFLDDARMNLEPTQKQFADFNAANS